MTMRHTFKKVAQSVSIMFKILAVSQHIVKMVPIISTRAVAPNIKRFMLIVKKNTGCIKSIGKISKIKSSFKCFNCSHS